MAGTATKLHVLDCGSMSCDLTWLLLKPGRSIRPRAERDKPVEWYPCTTHAVVVETPDGTMLWDTSARATGRSAGSRPASTSSSPPAQ